jgi:hypothetical protein
MSDQTLRRPRIRKRDFAELNPSSTGAFEPLQTVSVVVVAVDDQHALDLTLAALSVQSYPDAMLDVIVIHQGWGGFKVGDCAPSRIRVVRAPAGATAPAELRSGVAAAHGTVILRLPAGVLLDREHIEGHVRWHDRADYLLVVGGAPREMATDPNVSVADLRRAVEAGTVASVTATEAAAAGDVEATAGDGEGAPVSGWPGLPATIGSGPTVLSFDADRYRAIDGPDGYLSSVDDVDLCYRMTQAGLVLVPEDAAQSWSVSAPEPMTDQQRLRLQIDLDHRIPVRRDRRTELGRQWLVPMVDVCVDADGKFEHVQATIAGALASTIPDVAVTVVAPRTSDSVDLEMVHAAFGCDGRVHLVESIARSSAPAPFRFECPAGLVPAPDAIERLIQVADHHELGVVLLGYPLSGELAIARFERTEAFARAAHLRVGQEELLDLVHETHGSLWIDGSEWALTIGRPAGRRVPPIELAAEIERIARVAARRKKEIDQLTDRLERAEAGPTMLMPGGTVTVMRHAYRAARAARRRVVGKRSGTRGA